MALAYSIVARVIGCYSGASRASIHWRGSGGGVEATATTKDVDKMGVAKKLEAVAETVGSNPAGIVDSLRGGVRIKRVMMARVVRLQD